VGKLERKARRVDSADALATTDWLTTLRTNHGLLLRHNPTFCMADKLCIRTAVGRSSGGGCGIKSTDLKAAGLQQFFWTPSAQQYFLAILKTTFCMATAGTLELPTSR
jgi:hypothetical protein